MFRISNIEEINEISRRLGNEVITKISEHISESISENYIFVRYMGPKFVIVFCGVETESALDFVNELKETTESLKVSLEEENFSEENLDGNEMDKSRKQQNVEVSPTLNFAISTYYKGTGIESVLQKLEDYIDDESSENNEISNI